MKQQRLWIVAAVLVVLALCVVARLFDLTVLKRSFLMEQGKQRFVRVIQEPGNRGMIVDRHDQPLAVSTMMIAVWVNPQVCTLNAMQLEQLSAILKLPDTTIARMLKQHANRAFLYLKRGLPPVVAHQIKALHIPGLFIQREYRRFYPHAQVTAQVIGLTNIDDEGQEGLELTMNQWLQGQDGKRVVLKDRLGHIVADVEELKVPEHGQEVALSLDERIQYIAYRAIEQVVSETHARSASAVVLDVPTGEVLALANMPSYNPNRRPSGTDPRVRNRALTDLFEPGSTIKPFSVAAALMSGQYEPATMINTHPGKMVVDGRTISDVHKDLGVISLSEVLKKSSNVGVSRVALKIGADPVLSLYHAVGFGEPTQHLFPGEVAGHLPELYDMHRIDLATLSYGYGLSVTALQLASAYAVIANHGVKVPVTLLRREKKPIGHEVMPARVADEVLGMLETVVDQGGTGVRAQVPGFRVAGKTGTAEVAGPGGYDRRRHIASFVGMAPASHPRLVVAVVVREPQGRRYYASQVAAPVFAMIMSHALRLMNVTTDDIHEMMAMQLPKPRGTYGGAHV